MIVSVKNMIRMRAVNLAREYKSLFHAGDGAIGRTGEHVLADLRSFCFAGGKTVFDKDPLMMARREGRREVFMRMQHFLNLDEATVQKLMELDDGIG